MKLPDSFLIGVLFLLQLDGFSQCYFHHLYRFADANQFDHGAAIEFLNNGDLVATGGTVLSSNNEAVFTVKVNSCGDTIWQKIYDYSPSGGEFSNSILKFNNYNIYLVGRRYNPTEGARDGFLITIDSNGTVLHETAVNLGLNDLHSSAILKDGYIITAGHYHYGPPNAGAFLAKLDSLGNIVWHQVYDTMSYYLYPTVSKTFDGGYLLGGAVFVPPNDIWFLIKTDSLGNKQWERRYNKWGWSISAITTRDSSYLLVGHTKISNNEYRAYMIKTDAAGDTIWTRQYSGPALVTSRRAIKQLDDGSFVAVGEKKLVVDSLGNTGMFLWIVKLDEQGNMLWEREYSYYGYRTSNYVMDMTITPEGDIALTGYITAVPPGHTTGNDMFILKVDSCGYLENDSLEADFALTLDTTNRTVVFTNQSTDYCTSYWYFGDGTASNEPHPAHTYTLPGVYTITLIVRAGNSTDTLHQQITIGTPDSCGYYSNPLIHAAIGYSFTDTFTVSFTNQSTGYCTAVWYFGDGDSSLAQNPIHTYTQTGTYIVMLVAKAGISLDTAIVIIEIKECLDNPSVMAAFEYRQDSLSALTFHFTSQSTGYCTLLWDFGESTVSTQTNPVHAFSGAGVYTITHIATADLSADTAVQVIIISGIEAMAKGGEIRVYPNPAHQTLTIEMEAQNVHLRQVQLYDLRGSVLQSQAPAAAGKPTQRTTLNIQTLPPGIYFYRIDLSNGEQVRGKFVKE